MKKPAVTSFLVAQKMMKKRIDKIEKLNLNFDQGSTDGTRPWFGHLDEVDTVHGALTRPKWNPGYNKIFW